MACGGGCAIIEVRCDEWSPIGQQLNPYLTFDGNCAEAMDFYAGVFGGTPEVSTFRDSGMDADGVMHASLDTDAGFHLFASDTFAGMGEPYQRGNNLQISISGDEADALRAYWAPCPRGDRS